MESPLATSCRTILAVVLLSLLQVTAVSGAPITVTSGNDSGPGTLRQAIADALPGDTILLNVFGEITITSDSLAIEKDLTVQGPGAAQLAVRRSSDVSFTIFTVAAGHTVVISGLTITGGGGDGASIIGGAIRNSGTLTLVDCAIVFNGALNGGGIANLGGTLTLTHTTLSDNRAGILGNGGGIYNQSGTVTLINSTVARSFTGQYGGGIFNVSGILLLTDSTVSDNISSNHSGGIRNEFGTATLNHSIVSGNTTLIPHGEAGGISNLLGTMVLTNSAVSGNSAPIGFAGGILNWGTMTLEGSTVSGNSAGPYGGGIFNGNGIMTLINSTVSGNSVGVEGGGIANNSTLTLIQSTISGNSADFRGGGVIFNQASVLEIKGSLIADNPVGGNCLSLSGVGISHGYNLSDDATCSDFLVATGDLNNTPAGLDPGGLQNNGGPTQTVALLPGGAAVDAIPVSNCTNVAGDEPVATDQRGVSRPQGPACDIGAYELSLNSPPVITAVEGPAQALAVGQVASITARFTDADFGDTHTCSISWDDGTPDSVGSIVEPAASMPGFCEASHHYSEPGIYSGEVTVIDADGASASKSFQFTIYNPNGSVTGGGWIQSPPGSLSTSPDASGKATVSFVARYPGRADVPMGRTEFHFGNFHFQSGAYEWLLVAGSTARLRGTGTINHSGNYGFLLAAAEGERKGSPAGTFRIKIWDINNENDENDVVYDSQRGAEDRAEPTTLLGGGNIIVH